MTDVESGTVVAVQGAKDERLAYRGLGQRMLLRPEIVGLFGAALLYIFFWAVTRPFGNAAGIATVLDVAATLGIMAVAVGVLMIGGEFDLSSGAMTGAMGIIIILLVKDVGDLGGAGFSYWLAIPLSLVIALTIGWLNGTMVERTALPSFIVTLATFFVLRGLKLAGSKIIVDQIQVGRADEGGHYSFWQNIFGSEWVRGDHVWESRDTVYTVLLIAGGILTVVAIYELAFVRRGQLHAAGLPILVAGLAGVIVGIIVMHATDGTDWLPAVIIAASALVATYGLGSWRFQPVTSGRQLRLPGSVIKPLATSGVLLGAAVVIAAAMDAYNEDDLFFPVTVQGARAILFMVLAAIAAVFASIAVTRARAVSAGARAVTLGAISVAVLLMAVFVQSESQSQKFRTELFSLMLLVSLFIATWALASARFETRKTEDHAADRFGRRLAAVGIALSVVGVLVRLMFSIEAEILDPNNNAHLAKFSIRILWFVGFTLLMAWVLRSTKFGSWTYAVGGNKEAARQIGVPAARTKTQLFMIVAFAAWLVGILLAFRLNTIQAGTGNGEEFEYIIAAVVGGTLLTGGYGSAQGAAIGALIMAMAQQGISFAGWNTDWRFFFLGIILLVAVYANGYVRRLAEAMR